MSYNCEICSIWKIIVSSTFKRLHSVENINVYEEINHFKLSRFNDNETGQQIRKLVLKVRLENKHLFSYQFKKKFYPKQNCSFFKTNCTMPYLIVLNIFGTISADQIGINFKMFYQIFRLTFYKSSIRYHTL